MNTVLCTHTPTVRPSRQNVPKTCCGSPPSPGMTRNIDIPMTPVSKQKTPRSAYKIIIIQFLISCLTDLTVKQEKLFLFSYILPKNPNGRSLHRVKMKTRLPTAALSSRNARKWIIWYLSIFSYQHICRSGSVYAIWHSSHISHQDIQIWVRYMSSGIPAIFPIEICKSGMDPLFHLVQGFGAVFFLRPSGHLPC